MKKYKLTDKHPLVNKLNEVANLMDKYGIVITQKYNGLGVEYKGRCYDLQNTEQEQQATFPSIVEYKLTFYKENNHE